MAAGIFLGSVDQDSQKARYSTLSQLAMTLPATRHKLEWLPFPLEMERSGAFSEPNPPIEVAAMVSTDQ